MDMEWVSTIRDSMLLEQNTPAAPRIVLTFDFVVRKAFPLAYNFLV
jgi:hypothetical protein